MALTVRLDSETERCLQQLLEETGEDRSALIRRLIRERWQALQPLPTIAERLGSQPPVFLETLPPGSAGRAKRRAHLEQRLLERRR